MQEFFFPSAGAGSKPGAPEGELRLSIDFADLVGGVWVRSEPPEALRSLRIRIVGRDGSEVGSTTTLDPSQLQPNAQGAFTTVLSGVPFATPLLLTVEALDEAGTTLSDFESQLLVSEGGEDLQATLTPVEAVRSGVFSIQPVMPLNPEDAELLAQAEKEALTEAGFLLENNLLFYPPSPAYNWRIELAGQTFRIGYLGRVRIPTEAVGSSTQAILRHPSDDRIFTEVDLSTLSSGQIATTPSFLLLPFAGPCGMDPRTTFDPEEFCGAVVAQSERISAQTAPAGSNILPPSTYTVNRCNRLVPNPPESVMLARGVYPQPKDFYRNGTVTLRATSNNCEQANGRVGPGDIVLESSRGSDVDYLGSTCHKFVSAGACPNENLMADIFNMLETSVTSPVRLALKLNSWLLGGPDPVMLTVTLVPEDALSCVDNHKGRLCQEVLIGDVSLDFSPSGKGPIIFPDTAPETVILVKPNESVEFVLHNNGSFGSTFVSRTEDQLGGRLNRTYKEFAISPKGTRPGLQISTDALFNGTPTSGDFQGPFAPIGGAAISPAVGFFAAPVEVVHFALNPAAGGPSPLGWRYRYFPDLSLVYDAPAVAKSGPDDRYVFTVDDCSVAVTFRLIGDDGTGGDPGDPDEQIIESPVETISMTHIIGVSDCPQNLGEIPVSNLSEETVTVEASSVSSALMLSPQSTVMEPGATTSFLVQFNCSTQTSFSSSVNLTATGSGGTSQVLTVPVNLEITE